MSHSLDITQTTRRVLTLATLLTGVTLGNTALAVPLYPTPGPDDNTLRIQDLDIGADGDVFAIGTNNIAGTNGYVYQWIHGDWARFTNGYGKKIAVDPEGKPWLINHLGEIWRFNGAVWVKFNGVTAQDIDIGADGSVFILRGTGTNGTVYRWDGGTGWNYFGGYGTSITVDPNGNPWLTNSINEIWQYTGTGWFRHDIMVGGRDIDVGADGTVYMITGTGGANGAIYRWTGSTWVHNSGSGVRMAVSPTGTPNTVDSFGEVWGSFVNRIHGDVTCLPTDIDCNVCATDVWGQLEDAFRGGQMQMKNRTWDMYWENSYPPESINPQAPFDDGNIVSTHHIQGFVRTGNPYFPYAGSYSDDDRGAIFFIQDTGYGTQALKSIHWAAVGEQHPSGIHALGHYVVVADANKLRVLNTDWWWSEPSNRKTYDLPDLWSAGGGLGAVKTKDGTYLIIRTWPGSNKAGVRTNHFYELSGVLAGTMSVNDLGETDYWPRADWEGTLLYGWAGDFRFSENVSVITECETGQIYTLHTTGPDIWDGDGYFRLSRLEYGPQGHVLRSLDQYAKSQNQYNCYLRATGTAYVNDQGLLDIYCHEYDASHEFWENHEGVDFQRGVNYFDPDASCESGCGGSRPAGCWCDSLCVGYGDCCFDKVAVCGP